MRDKFACPKCGNEDYQVCDYQDGFSDDECSGRWWQVYCPACQCEYTVTFRYKLIDVTVEVSAS